MYDTDDRREGKVEAHLKPRDSSVSEQALARAQERMSTLDQAIAELRDRLTPVLGHELPQAESQGVDPHSGSQITMSFNGLADHADRLCDVVREMTMRLEI